MSVQEIWSDYLVLGSGIAGLCFALEVSDHGKVTILTKKEDFESNTNYAQGGIACVASAEDSFENHVRDTLIAGAGLCHEDVVCDLVREGPPLVRQLIEWGVRFTSHQQTDVATRPSRNLSDYDLGREGGHSHRRILHSKDLTGREVERSLLKCLRTHPNVTFLEHHVAIDLITQGRTRCTGAFALDVEGKTIKIFRAPMVVVATGGLGRIYQHTTNPVIATGDGVAMAWRAGLPVANLEFVQFHPTAFYNPQGETFLISEAVRGEGAILRRINGESFMERYDSRGCLAPRDVVALAIDAEMKKYGESHVLLDCSNMDESFFSNRFPAILEHCLSHSVHPPLEPIPVVPAAHYSCGGVITDKEGKTSLEGLYVVGEVAYTGVHGANRLASNSLLEALVFGHRAAEAAIQTRQSSTSPTGAPSEEPLQELPSWLISYKPQGSVEGVRIEHVKAEARSLMWDYVGIVRRTDRLELAHERLELIQKEVKGYFQDGIVTEAVVELRNIVQTAILVVNSALCRRESRGLHCNLDYPETCQEEAHDTILTPNRDTDVMG
jgi:L-aspartate oxidase